MKPSQLIFGPFRLDSREFSLFRGAERLAVAPKPFALLDYLARHAGRLVTKEELLGAIWPDVNVTVAVLKTCVAGLRHLLGDDPDAPRFIETVQRLGYRFVAPVAVSNVPARATSLVGRERELAEIKRLLESSRLVTLVGPAGAGKTSLATWVAADLMPALPHGACWIELAALSDPDHVGQLVATTLGVRDHARLSMVDTVADALQDRRMLLVLDNCEHLLDASAELADSVLRVCPHLKILATSREPLGVDREIAWLVPPLSIPDAAVPPAAFLACEAVRLFVERATESSPSFTVTDRNAASIADICRRLDGLPLAIELAAVRVKVLAPEQIAARLDDALNLLGKSPRTRQARHQTLTRAIDWSYDLLTPRERLALAVISVFAGSFTLRAAEAVCAGTGEIESSDLLELVIRLVDRSLVTVVHEKPASERRYRLLEVIRQYAHRKIPPHLEAAVPRSHAEFYVGLAEEIEPFMNGASREACLASLGAEYSNLRAVLEWSRAGGDPRLGLRLAGTLWQYWMHRGRWGEGRAWLDALIPKDPDAPPPVKALAYSGSGMLTFFLGNTAAARASLEEGVALWRSTDDALGLAFALRMLGELRLWLGHLEEAEALIGEGVEILRQVDAPWHLAVALNDFGTLASARGRLADAFAYHEDSAALMRSIHDPWGLTIPLRQLALLAAREGQNDRAQAACREALTVLRPLEDQWFVALTLEVAASIACSRGALTEAARLLGASEKLRETIGAPLIESRRAMYDATVGQLQKGLAAEKLRTA